MKRSFIVFAALIFFCSCATMKPATEKDPSPTPPIPSDPVQPPDKPLLLDTKDVKPLFGKLLKDISLSKDSFNPSQQQAVTLSYFLTKPATVAVNVYDPDQELIETNIGKTRMEAGKHSYIWDGKDMDGHVVPDEAYFFTIVATDESGTIEIYDPTTFSGGQEHDITTAHIDEQQHTISYNMPDMGRVMIRMGIQGGPLMNQLVDWQPRVKGAITEYWNGRDVDNLVDIYSHQKFKMIISYYSLPENSVITFGNRSIDYLNYKRSLKAKRPEKIQRATTVTDRSLHYSLERTVDYCPGIDVQFPTAQGKDENGLPILNKKTMVQVTLAEKDKTFFQEQQFEICFFLNYDFYAEDETGYTPFNWVWDLSNVPEGEHLLTVNISSFKDQIGLMSKKVRVVK